MRKILILAFAAILLGPGARASSLSDYKNQSMGKTQNVTTQSCPDDYKKDCKSKCAGGDAACRNRCDDTAESFCKERESRKTGEIWGLIGKGASLGAGAVGMIFDSKMGTVDPNGTIPISEYAQFWNRPSLSAQFGGGLLQGGTDYGNFFGQFRDGAFGVGMNLDYMWDTGDQLAEFDAGPTWSMGSAHMIVGFQPSVMIHAANGFSPVYGGGLRALTSYYVDRVFLQFDPLLGYINSQWEYDLKLALGYRITPAFSLDIGFSHRDILNLNDLNISDSGLNGLFVRLGLRMN